MERRWVVIFGLLCAWHCQVGYAELKVGVITSLSGPLAEYGTALKNGIELAQKWHGTSNSTVRFVFEDAVNETRLALSAYNKLVSLDHVDLIYVWGVQFCSTIAPLAERNHVPMIAQCVNESIANYPKNIVRFMNPASDYTRLLVNHLIEQGISKVGIVTTDQPYIEDMFRAFVNQAAPNLSVSLIDTFLGTQTDFRSTLARIESQGYDALGVFLVAGQISQFYRQLHQHRQKIRTFGTNFFESQSEVDMALGTMTGAVYVNHSVSPEFEQIYEAEFGNLSQITWAALSFEFAALVSELARSGAVAGGRSAIQALRSVRDVRGWATGPYRYAEETSSFGYFAFPLVLKKAGLGAAK